MRGYYNAPSKSEPGGRLKAFALDTVSMMLSVASADEVAPPPKVTPLITRDLEGIAGKEMLVLTVEYPPGDVHMTSANASSSAPAKFLVYMVKNKGAPPTVPVDR